MGEFVEVAKVLVSPAEKLIDCVSGAIGKMYEPRHLKKMAEARSQEIKMIGEAMRETSDIPIEYNKDGIVLNSTDYDQFVKRTQNRIAFQELKKQENIETVAGKAYNLLEGEKDVTAEPVEQDWMLRFFNSVEDISNEQMQDIWAKILAGEIKEPGTFSLRTLSTLHSLTRREALAFNELCQHCVISDNSCYIYNDAQYIEKAGIFYGQILMLSECGLINDHSFITTKHTYAPGASVALRTDDYIAMIHVPGEERKEINFPIYTFTSAGVELAKVTGHHMSFDEFKEIAKAYQDKGKDATISVHKIQNINGTVISYDLHDLFSD